MSGAGLVLCGTDTGVGKTSVACGLIRQASRQGRRLIPFKPAETGCDDLQPSDARRLCDAAGLPDLTAADIALYTFRPPVAPSVAAMLAGGPPLTSSAVLSRAAVLREKGHGLLVESAGGLLTPYGIRFTSADLAPLLDLPLLLISANRLGTISHTALALAEIRRREIPFAGLILVNTSDQPSIDQQFNVAQIQALTGVSARGVLRFCANPSPDSLADGLRNDVDLTGLF